jgi:hypothetical protein
MLVSTGVDYGSLIALDAVGDSCLLKKYGERIHSLRACVPVETDDEGKRTTRGVRRGRVARATVR